MTANKGVTIDGTVKGDVRGEVVHIGHRAHVRGRLDAREVIVHGRVDGSIHGKVVRFLKTARVTGPVWHDELSIEPGAQFDGQCRRNGERGVGD